MNARELDELIEAGVTASRERDEHGRIVAPPAWWDLPAEALDELYQRQLVTRLIERHRDPEGLSTTVRVVLDRLLGRG